MVNKSRVCESVRSGEMFQYGIEQLFTIGGGQAEQFAPGIADLARMAGGAVAQVPNQGGQQWDATSFPRGFY